MEIENYVRNILEDIKKRGIDAVMEYSAKFDGYGGDIKVSEEEFREAVDSVPDYEKEVIKRAYKRIADNHEIQLNRDRMRIFNGSIYGIRYTPLERIGMYIPGKKPLPSTVMMIGAPAKIAGVSDIIITTAPMDNGKVNPYTLYIAEMLGIKEVYKIGGIQAIGAMAFGTGMRQVDKIFGPGNSYVNEAKRQVFGITGIDGLYGPSEIMVITDENSNNDYIRADLDSQLEHGLSSKAWLLTTGNVPDNIGNSRVDIIVCRNMEEAISKANEIAPEHLEILASSPMEIFSRIKNAGAVYAGEYTPVPAGDYFLGVNHLLPTGGTARFSSVLTVDDFMKKTSFADVSRYDFMGDRELGIALANIENMPLHRKSMEVRS
ncbi:MAG: histidinol dehydrogenase [Ferroplasma sp.]|uniref:histidinol dehydrogenase n=1 Tax=Ferroplasma sp. TaxID=2591003 RepID=UPI002815B4FB|nr:histidinol dehydrogenase [Ferroplasma sp.]WMT51128.1 MAG: histidinol dehydrogenase [Ferroplasma sp.]